MSQKEDTHEQVQTPRISRSRTSIRPTGDARSAYARSLSSIPDGQAKIDGIAVGETAAAHILASRAADGAAEAIVARYNSSGD